MEMPIITETAAASDKGASRASTPAPAENPRAADARRASRPHGTDTTVHGAVTDRTAGRDGGGVHEHRIGGVANRALTDRQREMLQNVDKFGDVNGDSGGRRDGVSATGTTVVETSAAAAREVEKPAEKPDESREDAATPGDRPAEPPAEAKESPPEPEKPAEKAPEPAAPDPKLTAEIERLQAHNRKLVAELEHRGTPQLDDRLKALDDIERATISDPIGSLEKLFALAIGAKDHTDQRVQRFMAGVYGDWTERELKVPMDKAARAEFGTERNRLLIDRDKRERDSSKTADEAKAKTGDRERAVRETVSSLDRQLDTGKHADKFPLLMRSEMFDGISPGQKLYSAIAQGIAAGDWAQLPTDDVLIEHYSKQIEKEYGPRDQKLRSHYAPKQTTTSTATQTQPSDSSKDKAADAPAKADQAGARTITNASASVAPPTPPKEAAPATPTAKDNEKPKWRNEAERRIYLARQHFGDA